jgi:ABC-2 type transport system ATP-binding protein
MDIIQCNQLHKSYIAGLGRRKKQIALRDVSFNVASGEVFGIIGPNGAGKSTTLKILMGFIQADSGEAKINGNPVGSVSSRIHVGYLPENPSLYPNLTITEHLEFACRLDPKLLQNNPDRIQTLIKKVALNNATNVPIKKFSKGMTQRAALAYALIANPQVLILDEPMSGLDPLGRQLVIDIINECNQQGITILFCSHILTDVERICHRIAIMNKSRLISVTTPEEVHYLHDKSFEKRGKTPLESYFLESIKADIT